MKDQDALKRAKKRMKKVKAFYSHLVTYLLVMSFLIISNLWKSPEHLWFLYPLLGWGLGLAFSGFWYFRNESFFWGKLGTEAAG